VLEYERGENVILIHISIQEYKLVETLRFILNVYLIINFLSANYHYDFMNIYVFSIYIYIYIQRIVNTNINICVLLNDQCKILNTI